MTTPRDPFTPPRRKNHIADLQFTSAPKRRIDSLRNTTGMHVFRRDQLPTRPLRVQKRAPQKTPQIDMPLWLPEAPEKMTLRRPARFKVFMAYTGIIALALLVGVSFYYQAVGQWVIVGAGIAGIMMRINSILYFTAALVALGIVVIMTVSGQEVMASNYAVYAYLLLAFGTFHSIINLQRSEPHIATTR